jgi:lipopolysaccharide exporter
MTDTRSVAHRTAIGAGWLVAWRVFTRCIGLASTLVLARLLVPADFGLVAMASTCSLAVDSLSALGLLDALVRRPETDRSLYDTAFTMQAVRGLITGGVVALGAPLAGAWFGEPRLVPILLIFGALAALGGFENIGIVEFRRSLSFDKEFKLQFVPRVVQFVVTIAAAWLLQSYWALVLGTAVSKLMRLQMTYYIHPYRPRLSLLRWRDLIGFSFWIWAGSLASLVWDRSDLFILGPVFGAADLGLYMLAAEIAVMPITELVAPAASALFAGFALVQNKGTDTTGIALSIASTLLLLVAPLAIGVSATSGYIVLALLGPKWAAAQPLISTFAWLCAFSPFSYICSSVLMARGEVRRNFFALLAAALVKIVVVYAASRTGNLQVAAIAAVATVGVESLMFVLQLRGSGNARVRESLSGYLRIMLAGAVTVALLRLSGLGWAHVSMPAWMALLQGGLLGCAIIALFSVIQLALWRLAGLPAGPETRIIGVAQPMLARLRPRRASQPGI